MIDENNVVARVRSARRSAAARSSRIFLHAFLWPRSFQSIVWQSVEQYWVVPQGQLSRVFGVAPQVEHVVCELSGATWDIPGVATV